MHRIVVVALVGVLMAVAGSHVLTAASHAVTDARTAAGLMQCDARALDRYNAADPIGGGDPTAPCAGIAKRLQSETGAGEAAVAPAGPGR